MNPSVQCIFERTLAGIAVVAIGIGAIVALVYSGAWLRRQWKRRFPPAPCKPKSQAAIEAGKICDWAFGLILGGQMLFFIFFCMYSLGKDILTAMGICHLR